MPKLSKDRVDQIKQEEKIRFEEAQLKRIEDELREKERAKLEKGPILKQAFDFGFKELKKGIKSTLKDGKK